MTDIGAPSRWVESRSKRVGDVCMVVLFSPVLIVLIVVLAVLILCVDKAPPLFYQTRVGRNGVPFRLYKLNTMGRVRGDDVSRGARDTRATSLGKWLRWTILDEIPQILINVPMGHMALVGPRPLLQADVILMQHRLSKGDFLKWYKTYRAIRPGWTGEFGVASRRFRIQSDDYLRARCYHDLAYRRHATLWLDIKIIFRHAILPYIDSNKEII